MPANFNIEAFKDSFLTYLNQILNLEFGFFNPVFWIFILVLFLIAMRYWKAKKALSFCATISIILLLTTKAERFLAKVLFQNGEIFEPIIVRLFSGVILAGVILYFIFIRGQD